MQIVAQAYRDKTTFVFQPGGVAEGYVYTDWVSLYAALSSVTGLRAIAIDDSITSPAIIPAGSYDFTNVTLVNGNLNALTQLSLADGVIFTNLRNIQGEMFITANNTTTPVCSTPAVAGQNLVVGSGVIFLNNGTQPVWDIAAGFSLSYMFQNFVIFESGPIVNVNAGSSFNGTLVNGCGIEPDTITSSDPSATFNAGFDAASSVSSTQTGFTGSFNPSLLDQANLVAYSPGLSANWAVPVPTQVTQALDTIAAINSGLNTAQLYVDGVLGSDTTGNGSLLRPFATIAAAVAVVPATNTQINIAAGTYTGGTVNLPTEVSLSGQVGATFISQVLNFTAAAAQNISIYFNGLQIETPATFDLSAATLGGTIAFNNCGISVDRADNNEDFGFSFFNSIVNGLTTNGDILVFASQILNPITIDNGDLLVFGSLLVETIALNSPGALVIQGSFLPGAVITGTGNPTVEIDASSSSSGGTITSCTVVPLDNAPNLGYAPLVPANWATPPTDVQDALDDLAAAVPSTGAANNALSNLAAPTAINHDLLPGTANLTNLGAPASGFNSAYVNNGLFADFVTTQVGSITINTPTLNVASAAALFPSMAVFGPGISLGTRILSIAGTAVTLSSNASANETSQTFTFAASMVAKSNDQTGATPSGRATFSSGNTVTGNSGAAVLQSGNVAGAAVSGGVTVQTGTSIGASSGALQIQTGAITGAASSGTATLQTGNVSAAAPSGQISIFSGNVSGAAASGQLLIQTGGSVGGGTGEITVRSGADTSTGVSGEILLVTGASAGGGTGTVVIRSGVDSTTGPSGAVTIGSGLLTASGGNSGQVNVNSGNVRNGLPGNVVIEAGSAQAGSNVGGTVEVFSGNSAAASSGEIILITGAAPAAVTGVIAIKTGPGTGAGSGVMNITTGDDSAAGNTGDINIFSGSSTSANSGNVNISTGTAAGGTQGSVNIHSPTDMGGNQIHSLADPSAPQDAATQAFVLANSGSGANTALNNLTTTAINADLIPSSSNVRSLGSPTEIWSTLYTNVVKSGAGTPLALISGDTVGSFQPMNVEATVVHILNPALSADIMTVDTVTPEIDLFAPMDMGNNRIHNLADPSAPQDAATQAFVLANAGSGTVTSVSVASAHGFQGSSSGGATPIITIETNLTNGGIPYISGPGTDLVDDTTHLFWDAVHFRLGLGDTAPAYPLVINTFLPPFTAPAGINPLMSLSGSYAGTPGQGFSIDFPVNNSTTLSPIAQLVSSFQTGGLATFFSIRTTPNYSTTTAIDALTIDGSQNVGVVGNLTVNGAASVIPGYRNQVDVITITSAQILAGSVTLSQTPAVPANTTVIPRNLPNVAYTSDFTVSGNTLTWGTIVGSLLITSLIAGSIISVSYQY